MLQYLLGLHCNPFIELAGGIAAFGLVLLILAKWRDHLPKDQGRNFAVNGMLSAGKARGAGLVFVLVYAVCAFLFGALTLEHVIYLVLMILCMMTGYLDDAAKNPWGEYKKGLLDLFIAVAFGVTYVYYNGSQVSFMNGAVWNLPVWLYVILAVILVWVSINVTNCTDGVDSLSASLSIVTLLSVWGISRIDRSTDPYFYHVILFIAVLLAYLWFNAKPSIVLMGDAGSRAMGFIIAIAFMKSGRPFLYIPCALVMILDGGLGLVKVALLRFLKIHFLKNIRLPLHDQTRKVMNWSDPQTVFRFVIVQAALCGACLYLLAALV